MPYSGFKLKELKRQFNLEEKGINIFQYVPALSSSDWLKKPLH